MEETVDRNGEGMGPSEASLHLKGNEVAAACKNGASQKDCLMG